MAKSDCAIAGASHGYNGSRHALRQISFAEARNRIDGRLALGVRCAISCRCESQVPARQYRPDIDGLRCIAVVSVLLYHYGATGFPGGFVGVDIFFVISGYLITEQIYKELAAGRFSLLGYSRRVKRIIPALLLVIMVSLIAGWFLLWPGAYESLGASAAYSAFGLGNFYFRDNTGYFDQASELQPLLHLWSLGVEEQFYVAWPLLLGISVWLSRRSRHLMVGFLLAFALASFVWSTLTLASSTKDAFYLPFPRGWELALGGLIVFAPKLAPAAWVRNGIGIAGLALALLSIGLATASW